MAEEPYGTENSNGGVNTKGGYRKENQSLYSVTRRTIAAILFPDRDTAAASTSLLNRIRNSIAENGPDIREASSNAGHEILLWTRRGSPFRALLVITVGTITLLTIIGLLIFVLFFLAATLNAIIVSLFISLAAAGGFLALFFACVTVIYIGALSVAAFVIFAATISAVVGVLIAAGWIGFFWVVWLTTKRSVHLAKKSLSVTSSAILAYSSARHARRDREANISSD